MIIKIASCLLALACLPACSTTQTTANRSTLEQRTSQQYGNMYAATTEPAPPAEGPEDIPAEGPSDVHRNPALVPSPLLRHSAASDSP